MSQLDGQCLSGDNDQNDQIVLIHVNESLPDCIPPTHVGVQLVLDEFAQGYWKALVFHRKDNYDIFRYLIQMQYKQKTPTVFFSLDEFVDWDLCLWKEVNVFVCVERTNMYRLVDAEPYMRERGGVFRFVWVRHDTCVPTQEAVMHATTVHQHE